jgi:D-3-phosphoglycerate dehydrogenase
MLRHHVLITEPIHRGGVDRVAREAEVIYLPDRHGETVDQHLPFVDGLIVRTAKLTAERLQIATRLKVVGKHGVGVDNIDVAAARELGIAVVSTPGANAEAVAEHALTLMLSLARRISTSSRLLREGRFEAARGTPLSTDLRGKTLGLIGLGNIGTKLAAMCRSALAMRVIAYDPFVSAERAATLGIELTTDLVPLFTVADVVSIHTPLTPQTRGIVGAAALAVMKPSAILVNCARGGLVDEAALYLALREGRLAGAGLDVWLEEPTPVDHPLLALENVIATPHVAGASHEAFEAMALTVSDDVLRVLRGEPPVYPYQAPAG